MLYIIRIWLVVIVLSVLGWIATKVLGKHYKFWMVFLFMTVAVWGGLGSVYGLSLWFVQAE